MSYSVRILKDSIAPSGKRLTTFELTYPRFVHAELMTHRVFSRNSASSRAIPNEKLRKRVADDPALPVWWGKNQSGMQAREEIDEKPVLDTLTGNSLHFNRRVLVKTRWLQARDRMLTASEDLADLGLHKQLCNRLIEPWMFITVLVTATEYDNWFHLRDHKDAQPEIAWVAREMYSQYQAHDPTRLSAGEWHLPLIDSADRKVVSDYVGVDPALSTYRQKLNATLKKVSVGRCARVSYLTHDGRRDISEDIGLHDKLIAGMPSGDPLHMSPFEHVCEALTTDEWNWIASQELDRAMRAKRCFDQTIFGNVIGWRQYRKEFAGEHFRFSKSAS